MSLEELITSLSMEAESEKENILLSAHEEAARILERTREEVEKIIRAPRSEAARRLAAERAKRLYAARVEGNGLIRRAQGEMVDGVRRRVLELVEDRARGREWDKCLRALVEEAASGMPGGVLRVRPRDLAAATAAAADLPGSFRVVADGEMPPGIRLVTDDNLMEVDNTFPTRLDRYLVLREAEVAGLLFPSARHA